MITLPGYQIRELILEESNMSVFRAYSESTSSCVTMKIVKDGRRSIVENAKLQHEYEMAGRLNVGGILKPETLYRKGNVSVLTFQYVNGTTLQDYFSTRHVSVPVFLRFAIQVCEILGRLHEQSIIHMNIRPETLILVPKTQRIYMTGFGHAVTLTKHQDQWGSIPMMEGCPPYMAPERTGRMGWGTDWRSDLYSLGVTFYKLLTGRLPFHGNDPLEWAHAHLAKRPYPFPPELGIPAIVAAMIYKLLSKNPLERYQSTYGLMMDLRTCLEVWKKREVWEPFALGLHDTRPFIHNPVPVHAYAVKENAIEPVGPEYVQTLDLAAMMKASHAFSRETDLGQLLEKLLKIAIETAGGQQAALISFKDGKFIVEAVAKAGEQVSWWKRSAALDTCSDHLCSALIRGIVEQGKAVILNDASRAEAFIQDPYIVRTQPKSIWGLPISVQRTIVGVLYIENNLTVRAFSNDCTGILQMLASQMIYAIEMKSFLDAKQDVNPVPDTYLPASFVPLTEREIEVLKLMAKGMSNKEIAKRLFIAVGTVKIHVKNILGKLQAGNRTKAVAQARIFQLLQDP